MLGNTGLRVSALAFGGNQIGSPNFGYRDEKKASESIMKAVDLGINYFDTADVYGNKNSEAILGKALKGYRHSTVISTKAGLIGNGKINGHPKYLRTSLEQSLIKLKTDYVDIFLLHKPDPKIPIEESISAIDELAMEGKCRFSGVANANLKQLIKLLPIKSFGIAYDCMNILKHKCLKDTIPFCKEHNIGFVSYSPFSSGLLGKSYLNKHFRKPIFLDHRFWNPEFPYVIKLGEMAKNFGMDLPELSLAWVLRKSIGSIVVGTTSIQQLIENVSYLQTELQESHISEIDKIIMTHSKRLGLLRKLMWKTGKLIFQKTTCCSLR